MLWHHRQLRRSTPAFAQNAAARTNRIGADPVTVELERFGDYLTNTCGLAPVNRGRRVRDVGAFLVRAFGTQPPVISQVSAAQLDAFFAEMSSHLRPASLRVICNGLRSCFRYRALLGEPTATLADYAIARCLLDLGLRGHEVTQLTLESRDWRRATLTVSSTKSQRVQQLPLPVSTGEAIVQEQQCLLL